MVSSTRFCIVDPTVGSPQEEMSDCSRSKSQLSDRTKESLNCTELSRISKFEKYSWCGQNENTPPNPPPCSWKKNFITVSFQVIPEERKFWSESKGESTQKLYCHCRLIDDPSCWLDGVDRIQELRCDAFFDNLGTSHKDTSESSGQSN